MDFVDFSTALPFYVDYLGRFEGEKAASIVTATDALRELLQAGVQQNLYCRGCEVTFQDSFLVLRNPQGDVVDKFNLHRIRDPVAFKRRPRVGNPAAPQVNGQKGKGTLSAKVKVGGGRQSKEPQKVGVSGLAVASPELSKVVIFTEVGSGHFNNDVFHAFQCCDGEPEELVESIKAHKRQLCHREDSLKKSGHSDSPRSRPVSLHLSSFDPDNNVNGSVRSIATIKRGRLGHLTASSLASLPDLTATTPVSTPPLAPKVNRAFRNNGPPTLNMHLRPSIRYNTTENPIEKDIILLNYCIDDIERFIADLKRFPALFARQGLLPPSSTSKQELLLLAKREEYRATDFVSTFQKFKLAFNLLARLDGYIDDPPAKTLLRYLFPPLAFLLDESHELFDTDLVRDIASPPLTKLAVSMLDASLMERERGLWMALGENWLSPTSVKSPAGRSLTAVVPFQPRFHDGWSPGTIEFLEDQEDMDGEDELPSSGSTTPVLHRPHQGPPGRYDGRRRQSNGPPPPPPDDVISVLSSSTASVVVSPEYQDRFRDRLMDAEAFIGLVTHSRGGRNDHELTIAKGEYLEILENSKNWWLCRNVASQTGYVPCTLLRRILYENAVPTPPAGGFSQQPTKQPIILKGHHGTGSFDGQRDAKGGKRDPHPRGSSDDDDETSTLSGGGSSDETNLVVRPEVHHCQQHHHDREDLTTISITVQELGHAIPVPPPPPPVMTTCLIAKKQLEVQRQKNGRSMDNLSVKSNCSGRSMQEELQSVLSILREKEKHLEITTTPEVYVTDKSNPAEVQKWLSDKQFSQRAMNQLKAVDGRSLLSMTRSELVAAFGKDEGGRMDGQLIICKKATGYNTAKSSELRQILRKVRQRSASNTDPDEQDNSTQSRA